MSKYPESDLEYMAKQLLNVRGTYQYHDFCITMSQATGLPQQQIERRIERYYYNRGKL